VGTPGEVYERPASRFVAAFLGKINLLSGMVALVDEEIATIALTDGSIVRVESRRRNPEVAVGIGATVTVAVRPEELQVSTEHGPGTVGGTVVSARRSGALAEYVLDVQGQPLQVTLPADGSSATPGDELRVAIRPDGAFLVE
jgi:ABC-type Fe3+/spermidine/putrescine transport system ATPase subunit